MWCETTSPVRRGGDEHCLRSAIAESPGVGVVATADHIALSSYQAGPQLLSLRQAPQIPVGASSSMAPHLRTDYGRSERKLLCSPTRRGNEKWSPRPRYQAMTVFARSGRAQGVYQRTFGAIPV